MKQLRIGVHYEPSNIDPHLGAAELALQMTNGCFDTLVVKTPEGAYLPGLAARWQISDDQCTYTFHLREDVTFHDGTPFDAAAMKASLDRARDPANKSQLAGSLLGSYREARVTAPHVLEIHLDQPYALLMDALSQGWLAPMSPKAIAEMGEGIRRHVVGTGPFIFDRWEAGDCLVIKKNPAYAWAPDTANNKGAPLLDEILFRFLPGDAARSAALEAGEVDAIFATNPGDCARLRADGRFEVATWPIRGVPVSLMMNIHKTPTDSMAVRQAISHGLDVDALVAEVFQGEFERAHSPVSQFTLGYAKEVEGMYPHDPARANALLDEAGWLMAEDGIRYRDAEPLSVTFYALPVNFYPEFGQIVTRQLAPLGIGVRVELCSPPAWIAAGMAGDHNLIPQGKYASSSQLLSFVYHSRQSGPGAYGWSKRGPQDFPEIDALIDRAETALEPADYVPLFEKVQVEVMKAALAVPLHCNTNLVVTRKEVTGMSFDAIGAYPLFNDTDMVEV
ncbi:ABC transporter substrate-binding protein [Oceanicola sp. S124]|uniref:ABC transporter substrate-binding protein n=1 Tax=Oceanicola sp. S124 TaxID=1042378 RepID=UPI0002D37E43|nr:ABC transporter substrate-binding protein [Oceanicola sp. S124]